MKPKPKVKAVPVTLHRSELDMWAWSALSDVEMRQPFRMWNVFINAAAARRHAREFWAQYGCKVRFVK